MNAHDHEKIMRGESVFTGSMLGLLGINLATAFLSAITLGIAYPWLLCWKESWFAEHTYINGRRLYFDGRGGQLIGKWLLWVLLTMVTLGIYALWLPIKVEAWRVKHLHMDGMPVSKPAHYAPYAPAAYAPPAPSAYAPPTPSAYAPPAPSAYAPPAGTPNPNPNPNPRPSGPEVRFSPTAKR